MRVKCTTCLESLLASDYIVTSPCGHAFHHECMLQWLSTGKSVCPTCRASCRERDLRRVYFAEAEDIHDEKDVLIHKAETAVFENNQLKRELNNFKDEAAKYKLMHGDLKEEFRKIERINVKLKSEFKDLKVDNERARGETSRYVKYRKEAEELKETLKLYKLIDSTVKDSSAEVNVKMHEMGEYNKTARELSFVIVTLKKELEAGTHENKALKNEVRAKVGEISRLKTLNVQQSHKIRTLEETVTSLKDDLKRAEEDKSRLENSLSLLKDSMNNSPNIAVKRMLSEHPAPCPMEQTIYRPKLDDIDDEENSPFLKTKSNNLIGLNNKSNPKKRPLVLDIDDDEGDNEEEVSDEFINNCKITKGKSHRGGRIFSQAENLGSYNKLSSGKCYNGLGGHDYQEKFPKRNNLFKNINQNKIPTKHPSSKNIKLKKDSKHPKVTNFFDKLETP